MSEETQKNIATTVGAKVRIIFNENATTGYRWDMDPVQDINEISEYEGPKTMAIGAGGRRVFTVSASQPGDYELVFNLSRGFESGSTISECKVALAVAPAP